MPRKSRATPDHRKLEKSLRRAAKIQCRQKLIHIKKNCEIKGDGRLKLRAICINRRAFLYKERNSLVYTRGTVV